MKKPKVINIVLIIVAVCSVAFTVTCMWLFYLFQQVPDSLVTAFYTTVVGELLCTALIRMVKEKYKDKESEDENNEL